MHIFLFVSCLLLVFNNFRITFSPHTSAIRLHVFVFRVRVCRVCLSVSMCVCSLVSVPHVLNVAQYLEEIKLLHIADCYTLTVRYAIYIVNTLSSCYFTLKFFSPPSPSPLPLRIIYTCIRLVRFIGLACFFHCFNSLPHH